jgi:hypothetical protein
MSKETSIGLFYLVITILTPEVSQNGGYYFALNDHYDLTILEIIILMVVMECDLNRPMLKKYISLETSF